MTIEEFDRQVFKAGMKVEILSGVSKGEIYDVVVPDFDQKLIGCLCNPDDNVETDLVYFRCENCKIVCNTPQ